MAKLTPLVVMGAATAAPMVRNSRKETADTARIAGPRLSLQRCNVWIGRFSTRAMNPAITR